MNVCGSSIGGLHDTGASAGNDDILAPSVDLAGRGNQTAELAGDFIVFREGELSPRDGHFQLKGLIVGCSRGLFFRQSEPVLCGSRLVESRTAEDDDGRPDPLFALDQFWLQELESDPDGAQFLPLEKVRIAIGRNV